MLISKVSCELCNRQLKAITHTHVMKEHGISLREYMDTFPNADLYETAQETVVESNKGLLLDALNRNWSR